MAVTFPSWLIKASDAIRRLADQPWTLFALLLALNAIGRPCSITAHDARLYSLQALNQAEHGAYANDVFLDNGSQDQLSLFSRLVGPLVGILGLRGAFFLLYLVCNTLFILALFRLVRALVDDALISTLALIYLVTAPLSYGGHEIFMVHEQFFTARTIGTVLTLFALEQLLRRQWAAAFLLLLAGSLVHPLMAFGGVMIWLGFAAVSWLPRRMFAVLLFGGTILGVVLLCLPSVAVRLFGSLDDDWHQMIHQSVGYNYPLDWTAKDWINLGLSFALPVAACVWLYRDDPVRRRFLFAAIMAGIVGFSATVAASLSPYALLFQGQPYRVLWILKILQIPLGFLLIERWSQSPKIYAKIAALALVGFFCLAHYRTQEFWIIGWAVALSVCLGWMTADAPNAALPQEESMVQPNAWLWYAIARGFVLGAMGWTVFRWQLFLSNRAMLAEFFDLDEWVLFEMLNPVAWIAICFLAVAWWGERLPSRRVLCGAFASVALLVPSAFCATEISPTFRREHTRLGDDIAFVREFVHERRGDRAELPGIYSSLGRPELIWIDVRATSYFDILQTAGVMFHRRTAEELRHRIALVKKFEMERHRREAVFLNDDNKTSLENLYKLSFDAPPPTRDDLANLCREPGLDFIVIRQDFPGLCSASNGRIFVYECQKVRAAMKLAQPQQAAAVAAIDQDKLPKQEGNSP